MSVTPWWKCLSLRDEIVAADGNINDVQMSVYSAVHESHKVPYGDPGYYSEITHPTTGLLDLLGSVAVRLVSDKAAKSIKPVWRGDQGMGGGKSHAEVGLFHMVNDPDAFFATSLGGKVAERAKGVTGEDLVLDLGKPRVVVLPCDRMDPFHPDKKLDNIAETLGERWLWRLFRSDLNRFEEYKDGLGTPDGIKAAMTAAGGRVLTLVDEILNYVRKASAHADKTDRAQQDIAFLRDLMDATTTSPHAVLVMVMIASDDDQVAMGEFGEAIRRELEGLFERYGRSIATTTGGDFAEIIRRRLFEQQPPAEVVSLTASLFESSMDAAWRDIHGGFAWWRDGWGGNVARTYPFHPALLDLIETEWSNRAGFQRVRSTIQIFAATANAWTKRAKDDQWTPLLIGPGDLPLSDLKVRQSMLDSGIVEDSKTIASRREIAANDVVNATDDGGHARRMDLDRSPAHGDPNPRLAERCATALWIGSLSPRTQGQVGVTDNEIAVAAYVPDAGQKVADVQSVIAQFESPQGGLATIDTIQGSGGQPRRRQLSTRSTLRMFFRSQRDAVNDDNVSHKLRQAAEGAINPGRVFDTVAFVSAAGHVPEGATGAELANGLRDALAAAMQDAPETRLYVLDPSAFTLLNGVDTETRTAVSAALGLSRPDDWDKDYWPKPLSVAYAASTVFAVVTTQNRKVAVGSARDLIAWERVVGLSSVAGDDAMTSEANAKLAEVQSKFVKHLRGAFRRVIYLGHGRHVMTARLEEDTQTALDAGLVWKILAREDRAVEKGEFDVQALRHQLRDSDFGRSIKSIRDDFYRDPDRVLLPDGKTDLKNALYEAIKTGEAEIVTESGEVAVPARASDINLTSSANTLEKPTAKKGQANEPGISGTETSGMDSSKTGTLPVDPRTEAQDTDDQRADRQGAEDGITPDATPTAPPNESRINVSLMGTAFASDAEKRAGFRMLDALAAAIDVGDVSFAKVMLEVTLPTPHAEQIEEDAKTLGATVQVRPVR